MLFCLKINSYLEAIFNYYKKFIFKTCKSAIKKPETMHEEYIQRRIIFGFFSFSALCH